MCVCVCVCVCGSKSCWILGIYTDLKEENVKKLLYCKTMLIVLQ